MEICVAFSNDLSTSEHLKLHKKISEGELDVYEAYSPTLKEKYAIKVFPKTLAGMTHYEKETLLFNLNHKNVIHRVPAVSNDSQYNIILTEFATHGDFYDLVTKGILDNEVLVRTYFHQLIEGVEHIHFRAIAHLDLKLENLVLGSDFTLKIIDFDQSQWIFDEAMTSRGTSGYRAPEVIEGTCTDLSAVDVFSMGVILFAFKAQELPFLELEEEENCWDVRCYSAFQSNNIRFWRKRAEAKGSEKFFSQDFIELINGMLHVDPDGRWSINKIKKSKWYNGPVLDEKILQKEMEARWESTMSTMGTMSTMSTDSVN